MSRHARNALAAIIMIVAVARMVNADVPPVASIGEKTVGRIEPFDAAIQPPAQDSWVVAPELKELLDASRAPSAPFDAPDSLETSIEVPGGPETLEASIGDMSDVPQTSEIHRPRPPRPPIHPVGPEVPSKPHIQPVGPERPSEPGIHPVGPEVPHDPPIHPVGPEIPDEPEQGTLVPIGPVVMEPQIALMPEIEISAEVGSQTEEPSSEEQQRMLDFGDTVRGFLQGFFSRMQALDQSPFSMEPMLPPGIPLPPLPENGGETMATFPGGFVIVRSRPSDDQPDQSQEEDPMAAMFPFPPPPPPMPEDSLEPAFAEEEEGTFEPEYADTAVPSSPDDDQPLVAEADDALNPPWLQRDMFERDDSGLVEQEHIEQEPIRVTCKHGSHGGHRHRHGRLKKHKHGFLHRLKKLFKKLKRRFKQREHDEHEQAENNGAAYVPPQFETFRPDGWMGVSDEHNSVDHAPVDHAMVEKQAVGDVDSAPLPVAQVVSMHRHRHQGTGEEPVAPSDPEVPVSRSDDAAGNDSSATHGSGATHTRHHSHSAKRWIKRHKALVIGTSVLLFLALALAVFLCVRRRRKAAAALKPSVLLSNGPALSVESSTPAYHPVGYQPLQAGYQPLNAVEVQAYPITQRGDWRQPLMQH